MVLDLVVTAVLLTEPPSDATAIPAPAVVAPPSASPTLAVTRAPRPAGAIFEHRHDEGFVLRRVGLGVTIFGSVLAVGGVLAAYSNPCGHDGARGSNCEVDVRNSVALTMGVTALGVLTAGITSMAVGHALKKRQLASGFALRFDRGGGGLIFVTRF
jgi:hypothetical protein